MDHIVDWNNLENTEIETLSGLRDAIILKVSRHGYEWIGQFSPDDFKAWAYGRDSDEIDDIADDIHSLLAVEKVMGINETKH